MLLLYSDQRQPIELDTNLFSTTCYLVDADNMSGSCKLQLQKILNAEIDTNPTAIAWITPRRGCQSAWASKTEELLRQCGLKNISRIEKINKITGDPQQWQKLFETNKNKLHDRMTQSILHNNAELQLLFSTPNISYEDESIDLNTHGKKALQDINKNYALALSEQEIEYLLKLYNDLKRNPTLAELYMFAQANSEHCRHKIFNSEFTINGKKQQSTMFSMIRSTTAANPEFVQVAYDDNAAVLSGSANEYFYSDSTHQYQTTATTIQSVLKVESHNHPTAISPFPGAATGAGGELRDEAATGRGARPIAGLSGFMVSDLHLPQLQQAWEIATGKPEHIASALEIMLEAPLGAASYNNEFGRANVCGFFRSFTAQHDQKIFGYHKPIMLAGGIGHILPQAIKKLPLKKSNLLIVLGGPAMEIGLGGGAASSQTDSNTNTELDFASVQRDNPEMQRRACEVIYKCAEMADENPIRSLHDVGAGGLANALPELVADSNRGATIDMNKIQTADCSMSAMTLWCNEAQERFVLAIDPQNLSLFTKICEREGCPFSVVGEVKNNKQFTATYNQETPINLNLDSFLGSICKTERNVIRKTHAQQKINLETISLSESITRVLQHPTVADKSFLITINDRSVGGLITQQQLVGPWQVAVADVGVSARSFTEYKGDALAVGERSPIATLHPEASARMALAEAITNLIAADIPDTNQIVCSANWMAACDGKHEDAALYAAVQTLSESMCPALGIAIPVGKDSLSMKTRWQQQNNNLEISAPVSLVITASAKIDDVRRTLTPQLRNQNNTELLLIELESTGHALGASIFAQCWQQIGATPADLSNPHRLRTLVQLLHQWRQNNSILAYHDRSDGGLMTTLCEMAFASHLGLDIDLASSQHNTLQTLFNEEVGIVIQVNKQHSTKIISEAKTAGLNATRIATINSDDKIRIIKHNKQIYQAERCELQQAWSLVSYNMQTIRDNPTTAQQQYNKIQDNKDSGLIYQPADSANLEYTHITIKDRPSVAILREQGSNGQRELAYAFNNAGFKCIDLNMHDLQQNPELLATAQGLAICGGFSYGDVLGAGRGWALRILENDKLATAFSSFFNDEKRFALGVCNGCQMLSHLQTIIPGSDGWPTWQKNTSRSFEARVCQVEILDSPSILFKGLEGSIAPIVIAHAEGRAQTSTAASPANPTMRFVDYKKNAATLYPDNPNGSIDAITGVCNADGRINLMMPHPERVIRSVNLNCVQIEDSEYTLWKKIFLNALAWSATNWNKNNI